MPERSIARDLPQPRPQPLRLAKVVKFPPGRQERLLPCVFAGREIVENSERDPAYHCLVPRYDFHKRPLVASARGVNQFRVARRRTTPRLQPAGGCSFIPISQSVHSSRLKLSPLRCAGVNFGDRITSDCRLALKPT